MKDLEKNQMPCNNCIFALRLEAIALRLEAIALRLEAIALRLQANAIRKKETNKRKNEKIEHSNVQGRLHAQFGMDPAPVFRVMLVLVMIENKTLLVAFLKIFFETGLGQGRERLWQNSNNKTETSF